MVGSEVAKTIMTNTSVLALLCKTLGYAPICALLWTEGPLFTDYWSCMVMPRVCLIALVSQILLRGCNELQQG